MKPNLLFILADQMRWDVLGTRKPENLQTPHLDELASGGCIFENTHCQAPICMASRATIMSGRYPHQHGIYHNSGPLPLRERTWAELLREQGYETASVGQTHGMHRGFLHMPTPIGESWMDFSKTLAATGQYIYNHDEPVVYTGDEEYLEFRTTRTACCALRSLHDMSRPFALYVGYVAPHNPYILPASYADRYRDEDFPPHARFDEDRDKPDFPGDGRGDYDKVEAANPARTRRFYYTMVTMIDDCIGQLLAELDRLGLRENTMIILTSDHGEMLGEHLRYAKGVVYDGAAKVPLLIAHPDLVARSTVSSALVEHVDLFPTILDVTGTEFTDRKRSTCAEGLFPQEDTLLPGRSLVELMQGRINEHKEAIISQMAHWVMMRAARWKLAYGYWKAHNGVGKGMLFDLENDPEERRDLFEDPNHRDVRNDLLRKLMERLLMTRTPVHKLRPEPFNQEGLSGVTP